MDCFARKSRSRRKFFSVSNSNANRIKVLLIKHQINLWLVLMTILGKFGSNLEKRTSGSYALVNQRWIEKVWNKKCVILINVLLVFNQWKNGAYCNFWEWYLIRNENTLGFGWICDRTHQFLWKKRIKVSLQGRSGKFLFSSFLC